jgi:hypothetical protein
MSLALIERHGCEWIAHVRERDARGHEAVVDREDRLGHDQSETRRKAVVRLGNRPDE